MLYSSSMTHRAVPCQPRAFSKIKVLVISFLFLMVAFLPFSSHGKLQEQIASYVSWKLETRAIHRFGGCNFAHQMQRNGIQRKIVCSDLERGNNTGMNACMQLVLSDLVARRVLLKTVHVRPWHLDGISGAFSVLQRCHGSFLRKKWRCLVDS